MVAAIAEAVMGPKPNAHQTACGFILLRHLRDRLVEPCNRFIQTTKLMNEFRQRLAYFKGYSLVAGLDQPGQIAGVSRPLRSDHADFGQVAAQAVQQLRPLSNQHLPRLVPHQRRLVLQRAHADKSHRRPRHRLANRRSIRSVVLTPANIGLHISRRHHPGVMTKIDQLARPMMGRPAGLKPDQAGGQRSEKLQQLVAPDCLGDHNAPRRVNAVNLKDVLC
jgi:hypothetical protein